MATIALEPDLLLLIATGPHYYGVRRDQIQRLLVLDQPEEVPAIDERGKKVVAQPLEPLLSQEESSLTGRCHALLVPTRRRTLAFLATRVEDLLTVGGAQTFQPLPPLLHQHLARPWFLGTLLQNTTLLLVLDLRQMAQDVLYGAAADNPKM